MKKGKIIFLAVLGILVVGELSLRIFYGETLSKPRRPRAANPYLPDSLINYRFLQNSEYIHPVSGEIFRANSDGFPGPDFPEPEAGRFRIAIVGNSMISGDFKQSNQTNCCIELQALADSLNKAIDVMNFGIDGAHRSYPDYKFIRHDIGNYFPDMVLLQVNWPFEDDLRVREYYRGYRIAYQLNDSSEREMLQNIVDRFFSKEKAIRIFHKSYLVKFIFRLLEKYNYFPGTIGRYIELYVSGQTSSNVRSRQDFTMDESLILIKELRDELEKENISFFLFSISKDPDAFAIAKEHRLPLMMFNVDLEEEDRFPNDHHPNRLGNRKIAERMLFMLESNNLILPKKNL